ncbi:MAG: SAM-dependent DNA methyltransferase, partial [Bacteroidales bacterium]|nr:SAM-dependent DNA methyltransferase [Bacteroidales bacterium]
MIIEDQNKSIDKIYIHKLSTFIEDASEYMVKEMKETIKNDPNLLKQIKEQVKKLDIFKINTTVSAVDIQNICLLAGFLFFLKITVYLSLQKEVKHLKLKPLYIPDNKNNITNSIRNKFDDVLKFGYDYIFEPSVFDKFKFIQDYIPVLKRNIKEIEQINLSNINADIFGSIYNTLFNNPEQTEKGQHFTNTDEVDIVNAFCINKNTKNIIDTACGAGTFLVRAYAFLKYHHPELSHKELLEKIWGIDIASFPAFLTKVNLAMLDLKDSTQKPKFVNKNFSDLTKSSKLKLPEFDACIGNPPYIRQELIKDKKRWTKLARHEFGIKNLNKQSDLYVY